MPPIYDPLSDQQMGRTGPVLAQVLAARSSLLILAAPIGIALGAPLVAALGARGTLLVSALATIALGLVTVAVLLTHHRPHPSC
jgi:hypothetical protein